MFETVEEEKEEESTLTSMFSQQVIVNILSILLLVASKTRHSVRLPQFTNLIACFCAALTLLRHLTLFTLCNVA